MCYVLFARRPAYEFVIVIIEIERKMAIQGHVFWGQWKGATRGWYYIIMLASFPKVPKRPKVLKIDVSDYPTVVWRPLFMEPLGISAQTLYCQNLESLGYIFVTDCMGLSSFKFSWWTPGSRLGSMSWPPRRRDLAFWFLVWRTPLWTLCGDTVGCYDARTDNRLMGFQHFVKFVKFNEKAKKDKRCFSWRCCWL